MIGRSDESLNNFRKSEILGQGKAGLALKGEVVIDSHVHIGLWRDLYIHEPSVTSVLGQMDRLGISIACVSHFASIGPDCAAGNDAVAEIVKNYPGRFFGYAGVNPNYPDEMEKELKRACQRSLRGIKFHPPHHGYPVTGPNYVPALEFADAHGMIVLSHSFEKPSYLDEIAGKYRNVSFIIGHGSEIWWDPAVEWEGVVRKRDNVYVSLTSLF
jgi:predicted TIM-barrel fold metal-dependent hydrolase